MQIDVGYFYFVKDDFFDIINGPELKLQLLYQISYKMR